MKAIDRRLLFHLVDIVWGDIYEDESVPSTFHARGLIQKAIERRRGEKYSKQKLNIHGVMQAEGSDVSEGVAVASEGQEEANMCADFCKCVSPNDCRKLDNCLLKFKYHRA